jgi:hypothetical protein
MNEEQQRGRSTNPALEGRDQARSASAEISMNQATRVLGSFPEWAPRDSICG